MKQLLKINHILGKIEYVAMAVAVMGMAGMMICNSLGRSLLHSSIHATEEICLIFMLVVTFIGLSNAARNGRHVLMSAIYDNMPRKIQRISNIITNLIIFVLLSWITYLAVRYTANVYAYGRITTVLAIPMYLIVAIIPLGCLFGAFQYLITFLLSILNKDTIYIGSEKVEDPPLDEQIDQLIAKEDDKA